MEPIPSEVEARDRGRRGDRPARHGPADRAALRARRSAAGRARSSSIACEPRRWSRRCGIGLSPAGRGARSDAPSSWSLETVEPSRRRVAEPDARALDRQRDRRHGDAPRRRAARDGRDRARRRACARSCPTRCSSTSRSSRATRSARARGSSSSDRAGACCAAGLRAASGRSRSCRFRCPVCGRRTSRSSRATSSRSSRSRVERRQRMHRTKVKVARGRARRERHDRAREPRRLRPRGRHGRQPDERPGAGKTTLLEQALPALDGVRVGVLEGDVAGLARRRPARGAARPGRPAQHRPGLRRRVPSRREHGPLGAARRCRSPRSTCS